MSATITIRSWQSNQPLELEARPHPTLPVVYVGILTPDQDRLDLALSVEQTVQLRDFLNSLDVQAATGEITSRDGGAE